VDGGRKTLGNTLLWKQMCYTEKRHHPHTAVQRWEGVDKLGGNGHAPPTHTHKLNYKSALRRRLQRFLDNIRSWPGDSHAEPEDNR